MSKIKITTSKGAITLELFDAEAPQTVKNFLAYVEEGFYDGTIFHRVISNFMIQGGGFTTDFVQKPTKPSVENEADNRIANKRGTIAMARTQAPHSATAQFFINVADNDFLNFSTPSVSGFGYCVFGKVTEGMEVIDLIKGVATGNFKGHGDVPTEQVVIEKMEKID